MGSRKIVNPRSTNRSSASDSVFKQLTLYQLQTDRLEIPTFGEKFPYVSLSSHFATEMARVFELSCALIFVVTVLFKVAIFVQADLQIQGPLDKPRGLCATFVLPQGLNYTCEEYEVQTIDGFLLGLQRMYKGASGSSIPEKPVFLLHGILSAGDSWLLLDPPSNCLPFMLGEAGYDVWIGNIRTTNYGNGHLTLKRTDSDFWNWSLDELVMYDLPAMMEVVSRKTTTTIHYIGYSQGAQAALAAFSEGAIVPLLDKVVLLAPAGYVNSLPSILSVGADLFLADDLLLVGIDEFNMQTSTDLMASICSASADTDCTGDTLTSLTGSNCCVDDSRMSYYETYAESTATKNIVHFAQQHRAKRFSKYDYGVLQNLAVYASLSPPSYDMSAIPSMPLLVIHGGDDGLADTSDVNLLLQELKFTPQVILLSNYGHLDFVIGSTANVDCYSRVLEFLAT